MLKIISLGGIIIIGVLIAAIAVLVMQPGSAGNDRHANDTFIIFNIKLIIFNITLIILNTNVITFTANRHLNDTFPTLVKTPLGAIQGAITLHAAGKSLLLIYQAPA